MMTLFFLSNFFLKVKDFKQLAFHLNDEFDHELFQLVIELTMLLEQIDMKPFYEAPRKFKL
jgi:hypothetical protein